MATILKARGAMTKDLVTPYTAGDSVTVLVNGQQRHGVARVGAVGRVRAVVVSDPNDGDETFAMVFVKLARGWLFLHPSEIAPAAEAESYLWALRQIDGGE